jgi:hypothetical protein
MKIVNLYSVHLTADFDMINYKWHAKTHAYEITYTLVQEENSANVMKESAFL